VLCYVVFFRRKKQSKIKGRQVKEERNAKGRGVVEMLTAASESSLVVVVCEMGNLSKDVGSGSRGWALAKREVGRLCFAGGKLQLEGMLLDYWRGEVRSGVRVYRWLLVKGCGYRRIANRSVQSLERA
jgi:hypothetical protein